jgi:hypothetical protein
MKSKGNFQIERPGPGVLIYREGRSEFCFPIYDEDGETVFVAWPTHVQTSFFVGFGWVPIPSNFPEKELNRMVACILEYLRRSGEQVRVVSRVAGDERGLEFHPELFECKGKATEMLEEAGFIWMSHYSSVDLLHEEYGLEVCGIHEKEYLKPIGDAMVEGFPQWHYRDVCCKDYGREPGWVFKIHMFPPRCSDEEHVEGE